MKLTLPSVSQAMTASPMLRMVVFSHCSRA
jgi:hypothetical protein